jgi:DNA-binding IclR family transcriptional regulator
MGGSTEQTIRAVDNAFAVVHTLQQRDGAGVTELAEILGLSKSTVHSHLKTLEQLEYVVKRGDVYHLGLRWLDAGGYVRTRHRLCEMGRAEADELAETTGELVAITTHEYGQSVFLYQSSGSKALTIDSHVGVRFPLHCTANGKAMLAHFPEDRVRRIVDERGLPASTENTYTEADTLLDELERIRERGVALEDEERIEGTRGVGAPILAKDSGDVIGAVALCAPTTRLHDERFQEEIPELVRETAKVIEVNVTYSR